MPTGRSWLQSLNRDVILRVVLLVAAAALALTLYNAASSLYEVWQLKPGALLPDRWSGLLGANQVTQRTHLLSLLGVALLAGASLSCLVFFLDRVLHIIWAWLREQYWRIRRAR